ncbi:MAG: methyltransferase domain-containing protein [Akkermansiaceae bacterium]|jgi:predicted nicotinamide N-methyase|tara:strand:+ start:792 stop:1370 length:579 start_codon:yes stop_codon:yes gene_type:complete
MPPLFKPYLIGSETFALMELKHPQVEQEIIAEMSQGIDVYYDRRWATTGVLTEWFAQNTDLFLGKRVLIIGAGIGAETLILGRHASHIWINDISPTALTLCQEQLKENGIENATSLVGRYEELDLPEVDLVVASFLVYNDDTYRSMSTYMDQHQGNLILVNERLAPFPKLLKEREHRILFEKGAAVCAHFSK